MQETSAQKSISDLVSGASCLDDYDSNSMPVAAARKYIREYLHPVSSRESVPLRNALGRVLAADIHSPCNVPNHDNSAMDGYAFNADDLQDGGETHLQIIGTALAGAAYAGELRPGTCVRIMTGGVMPLGSDTVVVQERVTVDGE